VVHRVSVSLHRENVQNQKAIEFWLRTDPDNFVLAKTSELEHQAWEHIFDLGGPTPSQYLKTPVTENFSGSGVMVLKILAFAAPE
jgi:hypothetical protein